MEVLTAKSVPQAFRVISKFISKWAVNDPAYCWFRGSNDNGLPLTPGAYWRTGYDEQMALFEFVQGGVAFADVGNADEWTTYCLAQHHGMPTRLMDWTESFAAAMFFAFDYWTEGTVPCVWILQPCSLNKTMLKWAGVLGPENIPEMKLWLSKEIYQNRFKARADKDLYIYDNRRPLAIVPRKTNSRIHAQQGMFTVHGRNKLPLDRLIKKYGGKVNQQIARLDFEFSNKNRALRDLALLGIRRSAIYPDLDNFVRQIGEEQGWWNSHN